MFEGNEIAIADALRRKQAHGYLGLFSGDRVLAPAGKALVDDSSTEMEQYLQDRSSKEQRRVLENYYKALEQNMLAGQGHDKAKLDEDIRNNSLDFIAAIQQNQARLASANKGRNLTAGQIKELEDFGSLGNAFQQLGFNSPYKAEWEEALPGARPVRNYLARNAPILSKTMGLYGEDSEAAEWYRQFNDMFALVDRHQLFGSAYTANEHRAYKEATINGNLTKDMIQEFFRKVSEEWNQQSERKRAGLVQEGFDPASVNAFIGLDRVGPADDEHAVANGGGAAPPAAVEAEEEPIEYFNPETGQWEIL